MIPDTQIREVQSDGVQAKGVFALSQANSTHIMGILRDTLYTDKELAVLREYSSNAWDSHRQSGKPDLPIKVVLPTETDPTLIIRDFGSGLSEHEIFNVFTQYGESTKRDSDTAVGMLGIGSKSGFSYSDSFTVTSWYAGTKSVYVAFLDPSDKGEINKIAEVPCKDTETGLEIKIAVKSRDIPTFHRKAEDLFKYFSPRPDINLRLPEARRSVTKHGFISQDEEKDWVALMGCVPYRLDLSQIEPEMTELGLWNTLHDLHGGLFFSIGEVQVSASREELKYSDKTKANIVAKIQALMDTYAEDTLAVLNASGVPGWEKRSKARFVHRTLKLPIPKKYAEFNKADVELFDPVKGKPMTFSMHYEGGGSTHKIPVDSNLKVYFRDDGRSLRGYSFNGHALILTPLGGTPVPAPVSSKPDKYGRRVEPTISFVGAASKESVLAEFEALCLAVQCDGLPVENISSLRWYNPRSNPGKRDPNKKHQVRTFRLKEEKSYGSPWSASWEIEARTPTDDDLYVIITEFKVSDWSNFHECAVKDRSLAERLGAKIPPIYGYKTTFEKPITSCKGTNYRVWRKDFFQGLMTDKHKEIIRLLSWVQFFENSYFNHKNIPNFSKAMKETLGSAHPWTVFFQKCFTAAESLRKIPEPEAKQAQAIQSIAMFSGLKSDPGAERDALLASYPLLNLEGIGVLVGDNNRLWMEYIKLVDRDEGRGQPQTLSDGMSAISMIAG